MHMRFIRSKAMIITVIVMSALCLVAVDISIRITMNMFERKDHAKEDRPAATSSAVQAEVKYTNINKLKEPVFYYNGKRPKESIAFITEKNEVFVAIDEILDQLGIKFTYFNTDEILETTVNGKKLLVGMGKDRCSYGGREIYLSAIPFTARNHILVPIELIGYFEGFEFDQYNDKVTVFLNYHKGYKALEDSKIKVLKLTDGTASVSDITGIKNYWKRKRDYRKNETVDALSTVSAYIVNSGGKSYIIKNGNEISPDVINTGANSSLSSDGKYIYWFDDSKKAPYIANINSKEVKGIKDFSGVDFANNHLQKDMRLFDYTETDSYKRVVFTDDLHDNKYALINRKNKLVLNGNILYSPDMKKVLYAKPGKGYFIANTDGTNLTSLGNGIGAEWVNNNRVLLKTAQGNFLFNKQGKNKLQVNDVWKTAGKAPDGTVFFTVGNLFYKEKNGAEEYIMKLPWAVDRIFGLSDKGPYIATAGGSTDGIYYIDGSRILSIGKYSSLLTQIESGGSFIDYGKSITFSPSRKSFAVFQKGDPFISLSIIHTDGFKRDIHLNILTEDHNETRSVECRWLSDTRVLVNTEQKIWIVDFMDEDSKVYSWLQGKDSVIKGILP